MSGPASVGVPRAVVGLLGLPDPVYWVPVALLFAGVIGILYLIEPTVTDSTVPAFGAWIAVGASLHVASRQPFFRNHLEFLAPVFEVPMVYLTTATLLLVAWSISELVVEMRPPSASCDRQLGVVGAFLLVVTVGVAIADAVFTATIRPLWPTLALFGAAIVTAIVWVAMSIFFTETAKVTGKTGVAVLFAHLLDGITTGLGVAAPSGVPKLSEVALPPFAVAYFDATASLPVWAAAVLFVAVKLVFAVVVVLVFRRVVEQRPTGGRLGLGVVVAAGLGPGLGYVLLFTVFPSYLVALL